MCQRWFWPVLSILCLALGACGSEGDGGRDPGEQPGGSGGSGGTGGDNEGGSGGGGPTDTRPPLITITFPVQTNLDMAHVEVRGFATDDTGVVAVRAKVRGTPVDVTHGNENRKVDFSFEMDVLPGRNEVVIEAEDEAGNVGTYSHVYFPLPPRQKPEFERLDIDPAFPEPGEPVTISWSVRAVPDANVWLKIGTANATRENMIGSKTIVFDQPHREFFRLSAQNEEGTIEVLRYISIGSELSIWPDAATVATGSRQRFVAPNAIGNVTWTRDGAPMADGIFVADRQGTFEIVATTDEDPPRTASTTVTVASKTSPAFTFRGIGGQFSVPAGAQTTAPWFDGGSLSTLTPDGSAIATWDARSASWLFEELPIEAQMRFDASSGETWLVGAGKVARLGTAGSWQVSEMPWNEGLGPSLSIGAALPDGSGGLWIALNLPGRSELWHVDAQGSATLELDDVDGTLSSLLLDGTGVLWGLIDGQDGVWLARRAAGSFEDVSALPIDASHLAQLPNGDFLATGAGIQRYAGGTWIDETGRFPSCDRAACSFGVVHVRADGSALIPVSDGIYARQADGTVHRVGLSGTVLPFGMGGAGDLLSVAEASDGSLVARATFGIFHLPTGATNWTLLSETAILPGARIHAIRIESDGTWLLGGGGPLKQGGFHRSVLQKGTDGYRALTNESVISHSIVALDRLAAGDRVIAAARNGSVYSIHEGGTTAMPVGHGVGVSRTLGIGGDGTTFLSDGERNRVVKLPPAGTEWTPETGLVCGQSYARDPVGLVLWASDCGEVKRRGENGTWTKASQGLPLADGKTLGTRHVAIDEAGSLWLSTEVGVFRRVRGDGAWQRVGHGTPSVESTAVFVGGSRTIALSAGVYYQLSREGQWLPLSPQPPLTEVGAIAITADGQLLVGHESMGLLLGTEAR